METTDRSTLFSWIEYMTRNTYYFYGVFGKRATDDNIAAVATEVFSARQSYYVPSASHRKPSAPVIRGRENIQGYLCISRTQVYFYAAHGNMPHWREGAVWCAYAGRLNRWARTRRIGRYGGC